MIDGNPIPPKMPDAGPDMAAVRAAVATIELAMANLANRGLDAVLVKEGPIFLGQAKAMVAESEARYRHLVNLMGGLVAELRSTGELLYINPRLGSLVGCTQSDRATFDLMGKLTAMLGSEPAPDLRSMFLEGPPLVGHETTLWPDPATPQTIAWYSMHVPDGLDGASRVVLLGLDVTERNLKDQKLRDATLQADAANLAKSQFLANMSHDIRTPMNAIIGMHDLLRTTHLSPQQMGYLNNSQGAARSLLQLINDILDFSKIEAGKSDLELLPTHTAPMWQDLAVVLAANVGAKPVELVFDIDPAVPPVLWADQRKLLQILINLGGNALKFTASGCVRLRVHVVGAASSSVRLAFSVQDTGIGISAEQLPQIFSRFTQAEASTTRRFGGTGLGLAIASSLVELMGGHLTAESTVGVGSTFAFELEFRRADDGRPQPVPPSAAHRRVLVVSGVEESAHVVCRDLATPGWNVVLANSPQQGALLAQEAAAAGQPFDLVVMDAPEHGATPLAWLAQWQAFTHPRPALPVVLLLSGSARVEWAAQPRAVQEQVSATIDKPALAPALVTMVVGALNPRQERTAAAPATKGDALPLAGLKLLVVEDNELNRQVAQGLLTNMGAQVDLAENGQLGVASALVAFEQGQPYDVVLMDMQMPVMDGLDATRALRQMPEFANLPIVAMTANVMDIDREACREAGMNEHVGKPFDAQLLVRTLLALTQRGGVPEPVEPPTPRLMSHDLQAPTVWLESTDALARFGGDAALLERMRVKLAHDLPGMLAEILTSIDQQDLPLLKRQLHTMKGTCSTLGAVRLAWEARVAERQCSQGELPAQSDLELAVANTLDALPRNSATAAQAGPAPSAISLTPAQRDILGRLQTALASSDMASFDLMDELQQSPGGAGAPWAELSGLLDECDFEKAGLMCERLLAR